MPAFKVMSAAPHPWQPPPMTLPGKAFQPGFALAALATLPFSAACKKKPPTTAQESRPQVSGAPGETTVLPPASTTPRKDVEAEILSMDIAALNKKGYLTDAFFDYDQDGWLDIFKTNFADDTCNLYHNNGDGTFLPIHPFDGVSGVNGFAWADLDGDGNPDAAIIDGVVAAVDVVMLVMNDRGMQALLKSKFTLGGDASVAAGPVGREATAKTDATMGAEILSWSRARGVFAGVSLQGATLRNDDEGNHEVYGKDVESKDILTSNMAPPAEAQPLITALNRYSKVEGHDSADRAKPDK